MIKDIQSCIEMAKYTKPKNITLIKFLETTG